VLKWDAKFEDKGKHRKFDHLCKGHYIIVSYLGNNAFILQELNGELVGGGQINHDDFLNIILFESNLIKPFHCKYPFSLLDYASVDDTLNNLKSEVKTLRFK
jgi:hypothetical protein